MIVYSFDKYVKRYGWHSNQTNNNNNNNDNNARENNNNINKNNNLPKSYWIIHLKCEENNINNGNDNDKYNE